MGHARAIARQLRAGQVHLNYQEWDTAAAIIGYGPSE